MRNLVKNPDGSVYSPGPHAADFIMRDVPHYLTDEDIRYSLSLSDEDRFFLMEEQCLFILMAHQDKVDAAREKLAAQ